MPNADMPTSEAVTLIQLARRIEELEQQRNQEAFDSLEHKLAKVSDTVNAIETRRDAWLRTVVLAIAAPVAAGVFGLIGKWRDVEVMKFEQYNQLVDKALDPSKGEAYRLGVLHYIKGLDTSGATKEMGVWADQQIGQLEAQQDKLRAEEPVKQQAKVLAEEAVESAQQQVVAAGELLSKAKASESDDADVQVELAKQRLAAAAREEALALHKLAGVTQEVNDINERLGQPPESVSPTPVGPLVERKLDTTAQLGPGYIVVVSSDGKLEGARFELGKVEREDETARIVRRRRYYHVVIGPVGSQAQADERITKLRAAGLTPEARPRDATEFCPRMSELGNGVTLCEE